MPQSEHGFYGPVLAALSGWDPVRVDPPPTGIPDINHHHGWLEVKIIEWPKREDTIVQFEKFYQHQRVWCKRRTRSGGICHVLVKAGRDVMLFWGDDAADQLGRHNREMTIKWAARHWTGPRWKKELKDAILEDRPNGGRRLSDEW